MTIPRMTWKLRFGFHATGPLGPEYYGLIEDARTGEPIDTFYEASPDALGDALGGLIADYCRGFGPQTQDCEPANE